MIRFIQYTLTYLIFATLFYCKNPGTANDIPPSGLTGAELAQNYCNSCHQYVEPENLTKTIWKKDVLPPMGQRLGIYAGGERPDSLFYNNKDGSVIKQANIYPEHPVLAYDDWKKIVDYYDSLAPDTLPLMEYHDKIHPELPHFKIRNASFAHQPALTTMVKILPEKRGIVFADTKPGLNQLIYLDQKLNKKSELNFKTAPVHYTEKEDTLYLTTIGKNPFPNDRQDGDVQTIYKSEHSKTYDRSKILIPNLQRPVFSEYADIDQDGLEDIIVCEFGNHIGQLGWYHNTGNGKYEKYVLNKNPGAIHTSVRDIDRDGDLDIIALMSQGREGIYYYENNGQGRVNGQFEGTFNENELLSFSPLNGSQYFELSDFNDDGFLDILYVCGDNADKTPILKPYHGVYIFLNDGNMNFTQSWFFHQNGAYKAIPRDFDLDGDLDIAAISFYPDYVNRPEESFLYLENTGEMEFTAYSFPESTKGRWMVMDSGDMDGDGDEDVVLGSFVYFTPMGDSTGLGKRWMTEGPSVLILENTIK